MSIQSITTEAWRSELMASVPDLQRTQTDLYTTAASALILRHAAEMQAAMKSGNTSAMTTAADAITSVATALDANQPIADASGAMVQSPADSAFVASLMPAAPPTPAPPKP